MEESGAVQEISIINLILNGGVINIIIMLILFLALGIVIYIYIERLSTLNRVDETNVGLANKINREHQSDFRAIKEICEEPSIVSRLVMKVLEKRDKSYDEKIKTIENAASIEIHYLEKNISILGTISSVAPMLGFLGTVIGMILAFHGLASSGGQADMEVLADGLYTAMTTTVGGLIVGICASLGYNHLVKKSESVLHELQSFVLQFIDTSN